MTDYASLAEVRQYGVFKSSETVDNEMLEDLITRVSAMIDSLTGRTFAPSTDTTCYLPFSAVDGRDLFLGELNHSLLSVTTLKNGDGTTIAGTEYLLLPRGAARFHTIRLKEVSSVDWEDDDDGDGFIEITGKWGYSTTVPEDIKLATIEAVVYVYRQRVSIETAERAQVGGDGIILMPSMLPKRTLTVIQQYKKKAV